MLNNDQTLFKGVAWYYANFRRGYPASFYKSITKTFNLDKSSRALDLGTGTGQIALPLAKIVKEVVAVDINNEMIKEGEAIAKKKEISNIIWVNLPAEDISSKLGRFDITTMGASFHWMEQDKVIAKVYELTNKEGGVVLVANTSSIHKNKGKDEWKEVVLEIIKKYLGEKRRAGKGYFIEGKDRYEDILKCSKFKMYEIFEDKYMQKWDIDSIIGFLYSTSYAAKRFFGDHHKEFENELRNNLLKLNKTGKFTETVFLEAVIGKKQQKLISCC